MEMLECDQRMEYLILYIQRWGCFGDRKVQDYGRLSGHRSEVEEIGIRDEVR